MKPSRDDIEDGADLLAEAAMRACTFDFAGAEGLCRRIVALEDHKSRAEALLKANEHNRSSYLYRLARERPVPRAEPAWQRLLTRVRGTAGRFEVKFDKKAMTVSGSVFDSSPLVHVFINELLIASVPTAPGKGRFRWSRTFLFKIGTASLSLFPSNDQARLAISTGQDMLRHATGSAVYRCDWPGGKGGIEDAIMNGAMLTGHHRIRPAPGAGTIARWLDAYDTLATFMREERGKPLFLYYGSLLGAVRDNRIIPFDDDFDVGYFSDKTTPSEVKDEMISIIAGLAAAHPDMVIRLMNFFFKIRFRNGIVDVFPAWHDGHVLWSPWSTRLECDESDLLTQVEERTFYGRQVLVPARADKFLELKYGADWRTPDPTYRVRELPPEAYPFRRIPFGEDDRTRILAAARQIAGDGRVATIKLMGE